VWQSADPILGKYLTPDDVAAVGTGGGVFNSRNLGLYTYSHNSPVVLRDPDGRCPMCIGALVGGALEVGRQAITGELQTAYHGTVTALQQGDFKGAFQASAGSLAKIGISAAAGATGVGLSGQIGKLAVATAARAATTEAGKLAVSTLVNVAGNAIAGAGLGVGGNAGFNLVDGKPLLEGAGDAAKYGAILGAGGAIAETATLGLTHGMAQLKANASGQPVIPMKGPIAQPGVTTGIATGIGATVSNAVGPVQEFFKQQTQAPPAP